MKLLVVFHILLLLKVRGVHLMDPEPYDHESQPGYYHLRHPGVTNLTTLIGKTVLFNCTLSPRDHLSDDLTERSTTLFKSRMNPTWLKADALHDQSGCIKSYGTENIIVTRKGIIAGSDHNKMKLISSASDHFQSLQISNVNANNEGKYVCREFNSLQDKLFYLSVFARVNGLNLKLEAPSSSLRSSFTSTNGLLFDSHMPDENDVIETNTIQACYFGVYHKIFYRYINIFNYIKLFLIT